MEATPKEIRELAGRVINTGGSDVRFEIATMTGAAPRKYNLKPLEMTDLAPGYCMRIQHAEGRTTRPSVVEQLTNGVVVPVIYPEGRAAYEKRLAQEKAAPAPAQTTVLAEAAAPAAELQPLETEFVATEEPVKQKRK